MKHLSKESLRLGTGKLYSHATKIYLMFVVWKSSCIDSAVQMGPGNARDYWNARPCEATLISFNAADKMG